MKINVSSNIADVLGFTARLHPQFQFALAKAMTKTAQDVQSELYREMGRVWDKPTPFSQRSLFVKPATKSNLSASVEIKDRFPSGATRSPDEIYAHQYFGGRRKHKGLERYLQGAGLISSNEIMVPGAYAKLDAYGNMSRGQIAQVMSQLSLGLDPYSWKSKSRRSLANQRKAGLMFWSRGGHLKRGIWMRQGRDVLPIMLVVKEPFYKPRMNMESVAQRVTEAQFGTNLATAWEAAIATAR